MTACIIPRRVNFRYLMYLIVVGFITTFVLFLWTQWSRSRSRSVRVNILSGYVSRNDSDLTSFAYHPVSYTDTLLDGSPFVAHRSYLHQIGLPFADFIDLTSDNVGNFVFATAANYRFLLAAVDAIATVQEFFPNYLIIFYSMDDWMSESDIDKVRRLCNVEYRVFNYSLYPVHVRNLYLYAWKPLIIHEILRQYPGVFWFDASIRFHTQKLDTAFHQVIQTSGVLSFDYTGHSTYAATHPGVYRYLPVSKQLAVQRDMVGAGCNMWYRTRSVYDNVLRWWVLCALVEDCIAPSRQLNCDFHGRDVFAGCHRFDQSILNVLLVNYMPFGNITRYFNRDRVLTVDRGKKGQEHLYVCSGRLINSSSDAELVFAAKYFPDDYFSYSLVSQLLNFYNYVKYSIFGH